MLLWLRHGGIRCSKLVQESCQNLFWVLFTTGSQPVSKCLGQKASRDLWLPEFVKYQDQFRGLLFFHKFSFRVRFHFPKIKSQTDLLSENTICHMVFMINKWRSRLNGLHRFFLNLDSEHPCLICRPRGATQNTVVLFRYRLKMSYW